MATTIDLNWNQLISEWKSLEHGDKGNWMKQINHQYFPGKSTEAVKALFYRERSKRKPKMKECPKQLDPRKMQICDLVIEMKERGKQRSDKERELSTERCLRRLEERGIIQPEEVSYSHINWLCREKKGYREPTPRVRWEVSKALAEIQTDGTGSKYYRPWKPSKDGKDYLLKASGRPLYYKGRDKGKTKLILWQYQDKYSRLRIVRGIPAAAESTLIALATMQWWLGREKDQHPMRHLPWSFGHDNGAPFKTQEWTNIVKSFELDPEDSSDNRSSTPYEKTGIGSVERMWQTIYQYELEWSEDYPTIWLSEYNELMHHALANEQQLKHPVLNGFRGDLYQKSLLAQQPRPRVLEYDVFSLAMRRYERKVTSELNISIDNMKYQVPQYYQGYSLQGEWLTVWRNYKGELKAELRDRYCEQAFELEPFEYQMKGNFKSYKRTMQQEMKERIKTGDGFYVAVMNGRMTLSDEGEYIDMETGEVLRPDAPRRLEPVDEALEPDSPFGKRKTADVRRKTADVRRETDFFESVFKAKVWIGRRLKPFGITYGDVAEYFDPKLAGGLERNAIEQAVNELTNEISKQTKTA